MKKKLAAIIVAGVMLLNVTPAFAADMPCQGCGTLDGCITMMAPNCPQNLGTAFGNCVTLMATRGDCTQMMQ